MSKPSEHLAFQFAEVNKFTEQLTQMRRWGVLESDPGFMALSKARGAALGKLGLKIPRTTSLIIKLFALSPGIIRLFADAEIGWKVEAQERAGAPTIHKHVSDEVARTLLKGELTHALEDWLMTPDPFLGN